MARMVNKKSARAKSRPIGKKKLKKPAKRKVAEKPSLKKASSPTLAIGSRVPDFTMPAMLMGEASRAKLKGKPFVLYFYPKDDTSGCTAEACGFRDALPAFDALDITVIGVSKDSMDSHRKFSEKYNLTFPLASDENTSVCEAFGVWVRKSMYGRTYKGIERSTFLIDAKGILRGIWRKVSVPGHVEEVKKAIEKLAA
jgi:peroxiredoxin Q/BCP